jgi:hypothetical protein
MISLGKQDAPASQDQNAQALLGPARDKLSP